MTITVQIDHWYKLNNGEVHRCRYRQYTHFTLGECLYYQTGTCVTYRSDHPLSVSHEVFPKALPDLGVKAGDTVLCVWWRGSGRGYYTVGKEYRVEAGQVTSGEVRITGDSCNLMAGVGALFIITSQVFSTPSTWGEMTEAEQNELAGHEARGGKVDQFFMYGDWGKKVSHKFHNSKAYRKRPEFVVETVTMYIVKTPTGGWAGTEINGPKDTHKFTFEVEGGEPDCSTAKMERLPRKETAC